MNTGNDVNSVLRQYAADTGVRSVQQVERDFVEVSQQLTAEEVKHSLSEALLSEQTPPVGEALGQAFEQGDDRVRAGMLNKLIHAVGPSAIRPLVDSGLMDQYQAAAPNVTPELARRMPADLVQRIVHHAAEQNPEVIDSLTTLFAEEPELARSLDGLTLSIALGKMAENRSML